LTKDAFIRVTGNQIRAILPPQAPSNLEAARKILEEYDREERPYRTKWRREILGIGISLPRVRVEPSMLQHLLSLDDEILRCWFEVGLAYTYGLFQAACVMTCMVAELTIERYLRFKDLWTDYECMLEENHRTFGSLISYCEGPSQKAGYLTATITKKCRELNRIRIEAAHMNMRRSVTLKIPPQTDPLNDMDEIENVTVLEGVEKAAYMMQGDMGFLIDPHSHDIYKVRAFKHYARKAMVTVSEITKLLFALY